MKKLKILHIDAEKNWGGGEVQVFSLICGLKRKGHNVMLACPPYSIIGEKIIKEDIPVIFIEMRNHLDILAIFKLYNLMRKEKFDVVHFHTSRAHSLGAIAALFARVPFKVVTRRMDFPLKKNLLNNLIYKNGIDKVIAISTKIEKELIKGGVPKEKIVIIHSGINLEKYKNIKKRKEEVKKELGIDEKSFVVGQISVLEERKGHIYLIEAAARILKIRENIKFLIVGEGNLRNFLENRVRELKLQNNFIFTGFREDIPELLSAIDIFVLPSLFEGLGVSILEAMAMEKPVIATNVGGIPDAVIAGVNGILIPPKDSNALFQAILKLFDDRDIIKKMGEAGRKLVEEKFTDKIMIDKNEEIYFNRR